LEGTIPGIKKRGHCKRATYFGAKHYHRPWKISLPSSGWDRVEHFQYSSLAVTALFQFMLRTLKKEIKVKIMTD